MLLPRVLKSPKFSRMHRPFIGWFELRLLIEDVEVLVEFIFFVAFVILLWIEIMNCKLTDTVSCKMFEQWDSVATHRLEIINWWSDPTKIVFFKIFKERLRFHYISLIRNRWSIKWINGHSNFLRWSNNERDLVALLRLKIINRWDGNFIKRIISSSLNIHVRKKYSFHLRNPTTSYSISCKVKILRMLEASCVKFFKKRDNLHEKENRAPVCSEKSVTFTSNSPKYLRFRRRKGIIVVPLRLNRKKVDIV